MGALEHAGARDTTGAEQPEHHPPGHHAPHRDVGKLRHREEDSSRRKHDDDGNEMAVPAEKPLLLVTPGRHGGGGARRRSGLGAHPWSRRGSHAAGG
ncbi:MAG: hypothetical protein B7733_15720 [Myxococcales bacterium FL481]|nr:MAG: hypothetical protein B7733_15720 [Myxococcales bacterium FL481]